MSNKWDLQAIDQFIVIDNDKSYLFLCKFVIQRVFEKIAVVTYKNPQEAVDYFLNSFSESPLKTVVILDINMPELSGWEVLEKLSTLDQKIADNLTVIMHSSSIDPKDKLLATCHPLVFEYLEKPLTIEGLEQVKFLTKNSVSL